MPSDRGKSSRWYPNSMKDSCLMVRMIHGTRIQARGVRYPPIRPGTPENGWVCRMKMKTKKAKVTPIHSVIKFFLDILFLPRIIWVYGIKNRWRPQEELKLPARKLQRFFRIQGSFFLNLPANSQTDFGDGRKMIFT